VRDSPPASSNYFKNGFPLVEKCKTTVIHGVISIDI